MQCAQTKTTEDLASICDAVTNLQYEVLEVQQKCRTWPALSDQLDSRADVMMNSKPAEHDNAVADKVQHVSSVAIQVHRALSDMSKRKCNVVVNGIPECGEDVSSNNDEVSFLKLCEEHFSFKPTLSRLGCRRLGKRANERPRKLLVHLTSEQNAKDLLKEASKLRLSPETAGIYINPDQTPAEAAIAYQAREQRRSAQQRVSDLQVVNSISTTDTTAQSTGCIQQSSVDHDRDSQRAKDSHSTPPAGPSFLSV